MKGERGLLIRPFADTSDDYEALASLFAYAYPEETPAPIELRLLDKFRDPKFTCERWVYVENGSVKGIGGFEHWEAFYHPHRYLLHIVVSPEEQGKGVGSALYVRTMNRLVTLRPQLVRAWVLKENISGTRFAEARGFVCEKLKWNLTLDLPRCDLRPFDAHIEALRQDGVEFKTVAEMASDLGRDSKIHDLYSETVRAINSVDDGSPPSLEEITRKGASDPFYLNYTLLAVRGGEYIGMWALEPGTGGSLYGGALSVRPEYRRRGVALGLMVSGIGLAREREHKTLAGHTDEKNRAILCLTERLGFTHLPAQVLYVKRFEEAGQQSDES